MCRMSRTVHSTGSAALQACFLHELHFSSGSTRWWRPISMSDVSKEYVDQRYQRSRFHTSLFVLWFMWFVDRSKPFYYFTKHVAFLGELQVCCFQKPNGCSWIGPRENIIEHSRRSCEFYLCTNANAEPAGCKWLGRYDARQQHLASECQFEQVQCASNGCVFKAARGLHAEHLKKDCIVALNNERELSQQVSLKWTINRLSIWRTNK